MKNSILIGLSLLIGLCLMTIPVSAAIYNNASHGCYGSLLIPPWGSQGVPQLCPWTPTATAACDDEGYEYVHLTWPAANGTSNEFYYPGHPWDVGTPSWPYVFTSPEETGFWTALDFYTCGGGIKDIIIQHWVNPNVRCIAVTTIEIPVCTRPAPEFPFLFLPATMIIGMLGAVLLIQRTREH